MLLKLALPITLVVVVVAMAAWPRRAVFAVPLDGQPYSAAVPARTADTPLLDRDVPTHLETATFAMG